MHIVYTAPLTSGLTLPSFVQRGRPKGRLEANKRNLLNLLKEAGNGTRTNASLAQLMNLSESSIESYLTSLKMEGKIRTVVKRFPLYDSWVNQRQIEVIE